MHATPVTRHGHVRLFGAPGRVIARPFLPGEEIFIDGPSRIELIARRILAIPESDVVDTLDAVVADFTGRHRDLDQVLMKSLALVAERFELPQDLSDERRLLLGAYFTNEYSFEAAALGNPSMVAAPDQSGLGEGETRFLMSLRANRRRTHLVNRVSIGCCRP